MTKTQTKSKWYVVDLTDRVLGRAASKIALILRGKNKASFVPYKGGDDFVIILNAGKVKMTGNKKEDKIYFRHTGYPGGIKEANAAFLLRTKPQEVIKLAIQGMLPKTALGKKLIRKVKIYKDANHPHGAQMPQELKV